MRQLLVLKFQSVVTFFLSETLTHSNMKKIRKENLITILIINRSFVQIDNDDYEDFYRIRNSKIHFIYLFLHRDLLDWLFSTWTFCGPIPRNCLICLWPVSAPDFIKLFHQLSAITKKKETTFITSRIGNEFAIAECTDYILCIKTYIYI